MAFHPTEAALVTASEDHTLKLWNLQRTVPAKKSAGLDVEPLYTFRAHTAPVLCLAMGAPRSEECFSGGLDGTICVWNLPPPTADPYDPYDPAVQVHSPQHDLQYSPVNNSNSSIIFSCYSGLYRSATSLG